MKISRLSAIAILLCSTSYAALAQVPDETLRELDRLQLDIKNGQKQASNNAQKAKLLVATATKAAQMQMKIMQNYGARLADQLESIRARRLKATRLDCNSPEGKIFIGSMDEITTALNDIYAEAQTERLPRPNLPGYTHIFEDYQRQVIGSNLKFSMGMTMMALPEFLSGSDFLVENKCYVSARKAYHSVVNTYTGSSYEAFRQRADIALREMSKESSF